MEFTFTQQQADVLIPIIETARDQFEADKTTAGIFTEAYQTIYDMVTDPLRIDEPLTDVNENVWGWIAAARKVNADTGGFAAYIRNYTELQH